MRPRDMLAALVIAVLWGINFPIAKAGLAQLPPILFMALRFGLVAVLLLPFARWPGPRLKDLMAYAVVLGSVHFPLMFTALKHTDASVAAILSQIQVPFSALLAAAVLGDRLGWRRILGIVVAIGGVAILSGGPAGRSEPWAVAMILAASLAFAVSNLQMKRLSDLNGFTVNAWLAILATPQLALVSLVLESGQREAILAADRHVWGSVLYQAVVVVILCYGLWYRLLARYSVSQVVPWSLLVPVFGVASGVVLSGDPLTWSLLAGGIGTIAGVGIILVRRPSLAPRGTNPT